MTFSWIPAKTNDPHVKNYSSWGWLESDGRYLAALSAQRGYIVPLKIKVVWESPNITNSGI